ncbi:hypothetical protein K435DRAFT_874583 [Dendrothele bispora CBS 962.96]|uniref:Uncharacterized protein n=1 Tax=Dendrothele bispora (strain CBS 962.96) TaxID=1314807 RepID=A0A4S8KWN3_DENBC|nr:hypothetical protein K435DRAFT_874583 [Dendrothele bispora CBS 962.96]
MEEVPDEDPLAVPYRPPPRKEKRKSENPKRSFNRKSQRSTRFERAPSEAMTDLVESHIRDIVQQRPRNTYRSMRPRSSIDRMIRPSDLLAPTNHLSKLLTPNKPKKTIGKKRKNKSGHPGGSSDSSSSSSSSDSSSGSDSSTSDTTITTNTSSSSSSSSSSSDNTTITDSTHTRRRRHRRRANKKKKKMILKPDPPSEPYDGAIDVRAFIKFVTESTAYVRDGNVPKNRQVLKISKHLKGKAYEFYLSTVANSPFDWRLKQFFTELFPTYL